MRLREVKRKIEELGSDGKIVVSLKQQLGNFYIVSNSGELFQLLLFLSTQEWNNLDFSNIQNIIDNTNVINGNEVILNSDQYNQLASYVNGLNERLPIFFGIISSLGEEQGEFDVNIKLSNKIETVDDLNSLVSDIKGLEKFVNLDGNELGFAGFDTGSWWLIISAGCGAVYGFIIACATLAQNILKAQEQYYKTKEAKIHYRMTLKKDTEFTEEGLKKYCQQYCREYLEEGAAEIAKGIGKYNGLAENEIQEKAKHATEKLIHIIGNGNEVHVSLNSNNITKENTDGVIEINYEELRKLATNKEKSKKLEAKNSEEEAAS